jgi:chemosensory pili system protein ChpA (sensor histidine kinase/response regulator)
MSSIFETVGDVVDDTIDVVTDNKEILAAIALAYATGGASVPAETAAAATTAEIAAAEALAAEAAAANAAAAQTAAAQTAAQNAAIQQGLYSAEAANALTSVQAANTAAVVPPSLNASNPFQSAFFGDVPGVSPAAVAEGAVPVANQGYFGVGGKFAPLEGTAADYAKTLIPKTPGEYFNTALTMSAAGSLYDAAQTPEQQQVKPRSTTNTYTGQQAPKTYVTQPATEPLPVRYEAAKQQVSKTVGTPTNVGLLAVNNSPFYDFLRTNNLNRGIL